MDLLTLGGVLWRHRLTSLIVLLLTLGGVAYVLEGTPNTYQAKATYVLAHPAPLPDPGPELDALKKLNQDNPYLYAGDASLLLQALITRMNTDTVALAVLGQAPHADYTVDPGAQFGATPLLVLTATDTSPAGTVQVLTSLRQQMRRQLVELQKVNGADDRFLYSSLGIASDVRPRLRLSGKLRSAIGVAVLGLLLMFFSLSVLEAVRRYRIEHPRTRRARGRQRRETAGDTPEAPLPPMEQRASLASGRQIPVP